MLFSVAKIWHIRHANKAAIVDIPIHLLTATLSNKHVWYALIAAKKHSF